MTRLLEMTGLLGMTRCPAASGGVILEWRADHPSEKRYSAV